MRNRESAHKLWVATLNQMALINQSFGDSLANSSKRGVPTKAAIHSDLTKSSIKKNCDVFGKLLTWFKVTVDFTESEDKTKLISFSTGLISQPGNDEVNPEECLAVGAVLQRELDGLTFIDKISIKGKAKNLTQLRKQVKVNNKSVAVDPLKCFNRLVLVADRETSIEECLTYELTVVP